MAWRRLADEEISRTRKRRRFSLLPSAVVFVMVFTILLLQAFGLGRHSPSAHEWGPVDAKFVTRSLIIAFGLASIQYVIQLILGYSLFVKLHLSYNSLGRICPSCRSTTHGEFDRECQACGTRLETLRLWRWSEEPDYSPASLRTHVYALVREPTGVPVFRLPSLSFTDAVGGPPTVYRSNWFWATVFCCIGVLPLPGMLSELCFWWPRNGSEFSAELLFVLSKVVIQIGIILFAIRTWIKGRKVEVQCNSSYLVSPQIRGEPPKQLCRSEIKNIISADRNWIRLELHGGGAFNFETRRFHSTALREVCDDLGRQLERDDLYELCQQRRVAAMQFSLGRVFQTTAIACFFFSIVRLLIVEIKMHPYAAAWLCAGVTFLSGLVVVGGGATWLLLKQDSKQAQRFIAIGGVMLAAFIPVGLLLMFLFSLSSLAASQ